MPEEIKEGTTVPTEKGNDNSVYIEQIKSLKSNTVPKQQYEDLLAERDRLVHDLANGTGQPNEDVEVVPTIAELQERLFTEEITDLEVWKTALEYRRQMMAMGYEDPIVPTGRKIAPTPNDYASAERVAEGVQDCIDRCGGNPAVFKSLMSTRVK